jgi:hypothetical protein
MKPPTNLFVFLWLQDNILVMNSTGHLLELNLGGEDNNNSSELPKLNPIEKKNPLIYL